ncbi:Asp-tRNA(Asn)/Glu-tRNA(Gln) amidotransferase subunit GatA [Candidatus Woesearchaeota archaeon]|nr:Asp-tRNA(Asn)/Glu-tRNA(Gln) amidotransferase subunit GatA [Candidatus Woesearchaeota archaeon]
MDSKKKMNIKQHIEKINKQEINAVEFTYKALDEAKKINGEYHYLNVVSEELAIEQAKQLQKSLSKKNFKGKLAGLPISVKDSICVRGVESAAGSKILKGYKPLFNATAVQRCIDEGAIIIGKTSQDEFGFGSFSTNNSDGAFKIPLNPFDKERVTGGSSGGAAGLAQKADFPHVSLGESTGGSIACPSSFCGVVGLCPTYGLVSRFGLIDYGNSLDKIGPIGKSVGDCEAVLEVISGYDEKDSTSMKQELKKGKVEKVGLIKSFFNVDKEVKEAVMKTVDRLGVDYEEVELPIMAKYCIPAYYVLATAEASTNLAKYCGMRYGSHLPLEGNFDEYFTAVRSEGFGAEAKRRILLGTFVRMAGYREAYYLKAAKVRTKIIAEYKETFKKFDALVNPTMPMIAPKFEEVSSLTPLQNFMMDVSICGPNLAGLPHLSVPCGFSKKMPIGILFVGDHFHEKSLIELGRRAEQ